MDALMNAWYPIAHSSEVNNETPLARTVLSTPLVFYRDTVGKAVALSDKCPHRFAPLSRGKIDGDRLACAYHGLCFDASGRCVSNPQGDGLIPKAAVVKSFPVHEQLGFLWVWPGNADLADTRKMPDLSFFGSPNDATVFSDYLHMLSNYELISDNLIDLTHTDFLHPTTLSTNGAVLRAKAEVTEELDGAICVNLRCGGARPMAFFAPHLPEPQAPSDTWLKIRWWAPAIIEITVTISQPNHADWNWPTVCGLHFISPETDTTAHYFFIGRRNFDADNAQFTELMRQSTYDIFSSEDKTMLDAVQARMGTDNLWSLKPVLLSGDAGAVRARRRLQQLIADERRHSALSG